MPIPPTRHGESEGVRDNPNPADPLDAPSTLVCNNRFPQPNKSNLLQLQATKCLGKNGGLAPKPVTTLPISMHEVREV
jgi:hypothetical protein